MEILINGLAPTSHLWIARCNSPMNHLDIAKQGGQHHGLVNRSANKCRPLQQLLQSGPKKGTSPRIRKSGCTWRFGTQKWIPNGGFELDQVESHFPTCGAVKYPVLAIQPPHILKQNAGSANFQSAMSWIAFKPSLASQQFPQAAL